MSISRAKGSNTTKFNCTGGGDEGVVPHILPSAPYEGERSLGFTATQLGGTGLSSEPTEQKIAWTSDTGQSDGDNVCRSREQKSEFAACSQSVDWATPALHTSTQEYKGLQRGISQQTLNTTRTAIVKLAKSLFITERCTVWRDWAMKYSRPACFYNQVRSVIIWNPLHRRAECLQTRSSLSKCKRIRCV